MERQQRVIEANWPPVMLHVLAHHMAASHDIRLLSIKGPVATQFQLRPNHTASDADVLVDPSKFKGLQDAMTSVGFTERRQALLSQMVTTHSINLIHDDWPCDLDLHIEFPGMLAPPQEVFEVLWERRTGIVLAGIGVPCVDRASAILISGLHSLRSPHQSARLRNEYSILTERVLPALSSTECADLIEVAAACGATETASPFLQRVPKRFRGNPTSVDQSRLRAWRVLTGSGGWGAGSLAAAFLTLPGARRWTLAAQAVWPSTADMRLRYPAVGPTRWHVLVARLARLRRGVKSLPLVVRGLVMARRGVTDDRQASHD